MIKPGVKLHPSTVWAVAIPIIFEVFRDHDESVVITSGTDGRHRADSLHYSGMAFDFRTRTVRLDDRMALTASLQGALGEEFDVILEYDHIHIEHDPRRTHEIRSNHPSPHNSMYLLHQAPGGQVARASG